MVFESWETKFGMVVLHDNVKKLSSPFFSCVKGHNCPKIPKNIVK